MSKWEHVVWVLQDDGSWVLWAMAYGCYLEDTDSWSTLRER